MGHLLDLVNLNLLVYGEDEVSNFKNNSMFFYDKYRQTDELVKAIEPSQMKTGQFYFLHYLDDSNWIKYSPIFLVDYKKTSGKTILMCVNFNFIPLEVRPMIFDPYITEEMFEKPEQFIKVKYDAMYRELKRYSLQYSVMEYNAHQIKLVHRIGFKMLPRFLWSQHPMAKYDPRKLLQIWKKKYLEQDKRDKEMMDADIKEFLDIGNEISDKYVLLRGRVQRLQRSIRKYGGG